MSKGAEYLIIGLLWVIIALVVDSNLLGIAANVIAVICFILSIIFNSKGSYDHR